MEFGEGREGGLHFGGAEVAIERLDYILVRNGSRIGDCCDFLGGEIGSAVVEVGVLGDVDEVGALLLWLISIEVGRPSVCRGQYLEQREFFSFRDLSHVCWGKFDGAQVRLRCIALRYSPSSSLTRRER